MHNNRKPGKMEDSNTHDRLQDNKEDGSTKDRQQHIKEEGNTNERYASNSFSFFFACLPLALTCC